MESPLFCLRALHSIQTQVRGVGRELVEVGEEGEGRSEQTFHFCLVWGFPLVGCYWEMVSCLRVTQLYTAPTAIRMLYRFGDEPVRTYNRSSLRVLGRGELGRGGEGPLQCQRSSWYDNDHWPRL